MHAAVKQLDYYTIEDIYALPNGKRAQLLDYGIKLFKYRTAGVREYWIINPATRTENVYDFEHDKASCRNRPLDKTDSAADDRTDTVSCMHLRWFLFTNIGASVKIKS